MNESLVFQYDSQEIRTVSRNGEPWFVVKDVCDILELTNISESMKRLDEDDLSTTEVTDSTGRKQEMYITTEPGLYSLALTSRKPEAKAFKRWVTHEVIPQIRKTGQYARKPMTPAELLLAQAEVMVTHEKRLTAQEALLAAQQHKLLVCESRINSLDNVDIDGTPRQRLNSMIRKYARVRGINYSSAWETFVQSFNTAFGTNLKLALQYYKKVDKNANIPGYLEHVGKLEDAIRVMDKLLNVA